MSASPTRRPSGLPRYEIRLKGRLESRWATWFDGLSVTYHADGTTTLRGPVTDQAALHGVLQQVRDLGLTLISVTPLDPDPAPTTTNEQPPN